MLVPSDTLRAALDAADAARNVILRHYEAGVDVNFKGDDSPVTAADVDAERAILAVLKARFPDHAFYGEETGRQGQSTDHLWLIDPIDGTKSFVRACPFFSTQIALMHRGELVLGVSSAPVSGEVFCAERGQGAWFGNERLHTHQPVALDRAILSTGNVGSLSGVADSWTALGQLMRDVHRHRGYGDYLHYHLLAQGSLDVVIESDVNVLDVAALSVIVAEAGGKMTDLAGEPIGLDTTSVLASGSAALHAVARERISWPAGPRAG
ncbi:MAG: inositol monophosphatase family protein [Pseudomonadota bacterium]